MPKTCSRCGAAINPSRRFCGACGAPIPVAARSKPAAWMLGGLLGILLACVVGLAIYAYRLYHQPAQPKATRSAAQPLPEPPEIAVQEPDEDEMDLVRDLELVEPAAPQPPRPAVEKQEEPPEPSPPKPAAKEPEPRPAPEPEPADPPAAPETTAPILAPSPPEPESQTGAPPPAEESAQEETPAPPPPRPGGRILLPGSDAYKAARPQPTPGGAATGEPTVRGEAAPAVPNSGDLYWTGRLDKKELVVINGQSVSSGVVGGDFLPGSRVTVQTFSNGVEIVEQPSPVTNWKRFAFRCLRNTKRTVTVNFQWRIEPNP